MKYKNICVFCGANERIDESNLELARSFGRLIAENNMRLVYGGGNSGMMGAVSSAAHTYGAKVTGVFPRFIEEVEPLSYQLDNTIFVESMSERKDIMLSLSDAYVVLPGGFGTLDELFEVITLYILGRHSKPTIIVNHNGFWDHLIEMCDHLIEQGFVRPSVAGSYTVVNNIEESMPILNAQSQGRIEKDNRVNDNQYNAGPDEAAISSHG